MSHVNSYGTLLLFTSFYLTTIFSVVSMAVFISSSITSSRLCSCCLIILRLGFVTGCLATNIVQQSSNGWIDVSYVPIFSDISIISCLSKPITLNVVNFTDIQLAIYEKCPHDELTIIMRRYMMKIAEELGKESKCMGLVTGESIGQVASQTMQSLYCIWKICN